MGQRKRTCPKGFLQTTFTHQTDAVNVVLLTESDYFCAGSHLQRTGDTIAPSALSSFIALSTSLRSRPESSAILPALSGVPACFMVSNTVSFVAIIILLCLMLLISLLLLSARKDINKVWNSYSLAHFFDDAIPQSNK